MPRLALTPDPYTPGRMSDMQAKRGDLIVRVSTPHTHTIGSATQARTRVEVLEVTSVTRDGMVKAARNVADDSLASVPRERWRDVQQIYVIPAADINKQAVVEAVKSHHYPGHPDQPQPFDSVAEVKALLRPHLAKAGA